jgi:cyclase
MDCLDWIREGARLGAGEILLTSMDRDGTTAGYDTELLAAVTRAVRVSRHRLGRRGTTEHLAEALAAGADAVLAASIFTSDISASPK